MHAETARGDWLKITAGWLIVGFLEYRDSSLKKEIDVVRTLSLPVLALIPMMASAGERRKAQRRMWASLRHSSGDPVERAS